MKKENTAINARVLRAKLFQLLDTRMKSAIPPNGTAIAARVPEIPMP